MGFRVPHVRKTHSFVFMVILWLNLAQYYNGEAISGLLFVELMLNTWRKIWKSFGIRWCFTYATDAFYGIPSNTFGTLFLLFFALNKDGARRSTRENQSVETVALVRWLVSAGCMWLLSHTTLHIYLRKIKRTWKLFCYLASCQCHFTPMSSHKKVTQGAGILRSKNLSSNRSDR